MTSSVGTFGTSVLAAMSWSPCAVVGSRGYRWWTTLTRLLICVPAAWFASHNGPGGVRAAENCLQRTAPSPIWWASSGADRLPRHLSAGQAGVRWTGIRACRRTVGSRRIGRVEPAHLPRGTSGRSRGPSPTQDHLDNPAPGGRQDRRALHRARCHRSRSGPRTLRGRPCRSPWSARLRRRPPGHSTERRVGLGAAGHLGWRPRPRCSRRGLQRLTAASTPVTNAAPVVAQVDPRAGRWPGLRQGWRIYSLKRGVPGRDAGPRRVAGLGEHVADVVLDRPLRQLQTLRDRAVTQTPCQ